MKTLQIKAVMLDPARITEKHQYYHDLLPRLAEWGYNTVFFHFTDDEGCVLRFQSRPELVSPHAFSRAQMRAWVDRAKENGLLVIPELESFGHTAYIHGCRKYKHLREPTPEKHGFNAINPLRRETRQILSDLIEETAEVFDGPFLHAGLDEVNFGGSPEVKRALRKREKWEIFADHIRFVHERIGKAGKQMIMWGDHLLSEPRIADAIPKDIVICDWHYTPNVSPNTVSFFTKRGFQTICCPASNRSGDMILPGPNTQINLQRFSRIAHQGGRRVVGLMNTVWCPQRMIPGVEQFAMALGGAWFNDPEADPVGVVQRFLRSHFGIRRANKAAKALLEISSVRPLRQLFKRWLNTEKTIEGPLTDCERREAIEIAGRVKEACRVLAREAKVVRRNADDFANLRLAGELFVWFAEVGAHRGEPKKVNALKRAGRGRLKRCRSAWNRGRYADDPKRENNTWPDSLIPNIKLAIERMS